MPKLTGRRLERAKASKQFHNGRFRNTTGIGAVMNSESRSLMGELLFGGRRRIPKSPLPVESPVAAWSSPPATGLRVTWLGHSSLLVEADGARILIDPVFGQNASPVSFIGRKRFHPVPATLEQMLPLDAILLSHDHYDHLCRPTMRKIAKLRLPIVTSLGVGARLEKFGVDPALITELDWWEEHTLARGTMKITATPAQHFSGRGLNDRNQTLWSSWVLKTASHNLFYTGDTGLTDELAEIGRRLGPFDLSIIEIGASHPAWESIHLGPVNAMRAFEMLGGGTFLPVHWGTFDLALHKWNEPPETLLKLAAQNGARVLTPPLGRAIEPAIVEGATPWWRGL